MCYYSVAAEGCGQRDNVPTVVRCPHHLPILYEPLSPLSYNANAPTASAATSIADWLMTKLHTLHLQINSFALCHTSCCETVQISQYGATYLLDIPKGGRPGGYEFDLE